VAIASLDVRVLGHQRRGSPTVAALAWWCTDPPHVARSATSCGLGRPRRPNVGWAARC